MCHLPIRPSRSRRAAAPGERREGVARGTAIGVVDDAVAVRVESVRMLARLGEQSGPSWQSVQENRAPSRPGDRCSASSRRDAPRPRRRRSGDRRPRSGRCWGAWAAGAVPCCRDERCRKPAITPERLLADSEHSADGNTPFSDSCLDGVAQATGCGVRPFVLTGCTKPADASSKGGRRDHAGGREMDH